MTHPPVHPTKGEAKPLARPDLWDVLTVVRKTPGAATYVYRNILDRDGFRGLGTPTVLRRLKRLEALGKVRRARTSYLVQICWEPVEASASPRPHTPGDRE